MGINTDLNVDPYYDDFAEAKQFNRILFKPAKAVQARELTQLQTILQKQVERFGSNIYKVRLLPVLTLPLVLTSSMLS